MEIFTLLLALFIGFVSLGLILFVLRAVFSPLIGDPRGFSERWKYRKKIKLLAEVDRLIGEGATDGAANYLSNCFYLEQIRLNPALIARINSHHLSILGSILTVADRKGIHLENLAIVEDLLGTRTQLMKSHLETSETRRELKSKRKEDGKPVPGWAAQEYDKKLAELADKLKTNRQSLTRQLDELFKKLESVQADKEATYH